MKRLLTTLVILTGLIGSAGAMWGDAQSDFDKGLAAYKVSKHTEAVKWWRTAAKQGDAVAQVNLGWMYAQGNGVTQDYAEAVKWWRKVAEQGHKHAQIKLGVMYKEGNGVTQDTIAAHMWFNIAAKNRSSEWSIDIVEEAANHRDIVAKKLSAEQLEKAKKRAKRCMSSGHKECD